MKNHCPLCQSSGELFSQDNQRSYYECDNCKGIYVDDNRRPVGDAEKEHYQQHNNDVEDEGYQKFVSPITSGIMRYFTTNQKGLDFGAGTGPVISKVLQDNGFSIVQYDPYFHNYPDLLEGKYDFIACCEVIEHFHNPQKEFSLLKNLLLEKGKLYCMTDIYNESIDFGKWYYKNDPTHVFFYQESTVQWIQKEFGFSDVCVEGRLITFSN